MDDLSQRVNSLNIYNPTSFEIGEQNWLFFDIFIKGNAIIGIGPFEPSTKAKLDINYKRIFCKIGSVLIKGSMVKDPHNHTLIMRFRSRELTNLLEQRNELQCTIIAGTIERSFHLVKPEHMGKGRLCLSTLQKNEYEYIATWIEYHQKVGVEHFYIYDNGTDDLERLYGLLLPFIKQGIVTLIKWPFSYYRSVDDNSGQTSQQNHTLYRFTGEWMIGLTDVDEYIFPVQIKDLYKFLKSISNLNNLLMGVLSGVSLRSIWFGCNYNIQYNYQNFLLKLTMRKNEPEPRYHREKCIVFPNKVKVFSTHMVVRGRLVWFLPFSWLRLNHYFALCKRSCVHEVYDQVSDDSILKIIG